MEIAHQEGAVSEGAAPQLEPRHDGNVSQTSQDSHTASDFINSQLQLEADAREALPYNFDHCTQPLGPLRQNLFSCLTCNPPPESSSDPYTPAAVCYSCSIACHGEHTLVELFNRRNFTCDCGTTRLPPTSPCTLRIDPSTGMKGPVHSQAPAEGNEYNQNCRNRFCGCGEVYNAEEEKGTMFQCLGLAPEANSGCGEDWWHPECVVGLGRQCQKKTNATLDASGDNSEGEERSLPLGFPDEDAFDTFICYKCVKANPWIKPYAGTAGFLPPVHKRDPKAEAALSHGIATKSTEPTKSELETVDDASVLGPSASMFNTSNKRKASDAELDESSSDAKKGKSDPPNQAYHDTLPPAPTGTFSLLLHEDFRDHMCRCRDCYPTLKTHPQLLEEEESYEPPLSESGGDGGAESVGTGSLYDRGEAALNNVDRVRAIEGVMAYNHLKDKVKTFLQPFAESGQAVGAQDVKAYFEKLRGDEQAIKAAGLASGGGDGGDGSGDSRREQSGY